LLSFGIAIAVVGYINVTGHSLLLTMNLPHLNYSQIPALYCKGDDAGKSQTLLTSKTPIQ